MLVLRYTQAGFPPLDEARGEAARAAVVRQFLRRQLGRTVHVLGIRYVGRGYVGPGTAELYAVTVTGSAGALEEITDRLAVTSRYSLWFEDVGHRRPKRKAKR